MRFLRNSSFLFLLMIWICLAIFGCDSETDSPHQKVESTQQLSVPLAEPLARMATSESPLAAEVTVDGGTPTSLTIDLQNKKVSGRIDGLTPGQHTLAITYRMNNLIVATWSSQVGVKAGETSLVVIDSAILQYPDDDQDGLSNLQELLTGSDPKDTNSPARLLSIHVTASDTNIGVGATLQLKVAGSFSQGAVRDLTPFMNWQSSSNDIATVSGTGLVTAISPGTVVITATYPASNLSENIQLTVIPADCLVGPNASCPSSPRDTFYVSTSGSDDNPGTEALPWQTVQKAASTLTAGQTALIRGGTYNEHDIVFTNSGSDGSPITIKAYPEETPIIDGGYTTSAGRHPIFMIDGQSYITLDGLTLTRGALSNIFLAYNSPTTHITIQNCTITNFVTDDGSAGIYINTGGADNILIQNNRIHDRIVDAYPEQGSGIIIFGSLSITIQNNEIYNLVEGVFYSLNKPGNMTILVQNNLIHDTTKGIAWTMHDATIKNNVVYRSAVAMTVAEISGDCSTVNSDGNQVLHNTFVDDEVGIVLKTAECPGATNTILKDNLVFNFTNAEYRGVAIYPYGATSDTSSTTFDHNLIYSSSFSSPIRVLDSYYTTDTVPNSVTGSGNVQSAPNFQDYTRGDFTLLTGPGKNAALDGTDVGAKFCSVGINAPCSAP